VVNKDYYNCMRCGVVHSGPCIGMKTVFDCRECGQTCMVHAQPSHGGKDTFVQPQVPDDGFVYVPVAKPRRQVPFDMPTTREPDHKSDYHSPPKNGVMRQCAFCTSAHITRKTCPTCINCCETAVYVCDDCRPTSPPTTVCVYCLARPKKKVDVLPTKPIKTCKCDKPVLVRSQKENANYNRFFWSCRDCSYFAWV
jgi:hypothetical protein